MKVKDYNLENLYWVVSDPRVPQYSWDSTGKSPEHLHFCFCPSEHWACRTTPEAFWGAKIRTVERPLMFFSANIMVVLFAFKILRSSRQHCLSDLWEKKSRMAGFGKDWLHKIPAQVSTSLCCAECHCDLLFKLLQVPAPGQWLLVSITAACFSWSQSFKISTTMPICGRW